MSLNLLRDSQRKEEVHRFSKARLCSESPDTEVEENNNKKRI